jgi:hypothetical protein
MKCKAYLLVVFIAAMAVHGAVSAQPLDCSYGWSDQWGSGWCDFRAPMNLAQGICMRLLIGGTANQILVRVLRDGEDPNRPVGLLGDPMSVPKDRKVIIKLDRTYSNVVQISVHGGRKAWHISLGGQNGPATLQLVERVSCP